MLPRPVIGYLAEVISFLYTKSQLEVLCLQFDVQPQGANKLEMALNLCYKCPEDREIELIERVIKDYRDFSLDDARIEAIRYYEGFDPEVRFRGLLRALETEMLYQVNEDGKLSPIVEQEVKERLLEERAFVKEKLENLGLYEEARLYSQAISQIHLNPIGALTSFRVILEHLIESFLLESGRHSTGTMRDKIMKLKEIAILHETKKANLEPDVVYDLYSMLSEYGAHAKNLSQELTTYLYQWSIVTLAFLLRRYESVKKMSEG